MKTSSKWLLPVMMILILIICIGMVLKEGAKASHRWGPNQIRRLIDSELPPKSELHELQAWAVRHQLSMSVSERGPYRGPYGDVLVAQDLASIRRTATIDIYNQ